MTETEITRVQELWAQWEERKAELENLRWEQSQLDWQIRHVRDEMQHLTHLIEDIEGEIDWG